MYIKVQEFKNLGFSKRKTARMLGINRETIAKYWDKTIEEYTAMAEQVKKQGSLLKFESVCAGPIWLNGQAGARTRYGSSYNGYRVLRKK